MTTRPITLRDWQARAFASRSSDRPALYLLVQTPSGSGLDVSASPTYAAPYSRTPVFLTYGGSYVRKMAGI